MPLHCLEDDSERKGLTITLGNRWDTPLPHELCQYQMDLKKLLDADQSSESAKSRSESVEAQVSKVEVVIRHITSS